VAIVSGREKPLAAMGALAIFAAADPPSLSFGMAGTAATTAYSLMHRKRLMMWASNCYLIFDRMPSISSLRKARMVWVLTFPNELTLQAKAVMVSSSGASNKTTTS
jgi:hypothetical protein